MDSFVNHGREQLPERCVAPRGRAQLVRNRINGQHRPGLYTFFVLCTGSTSQCLVFYALYHSCGVLGRSVLQCDQSDAGGPALDPTMGENIECTSVWYPDLNLGTIH